MSGRSRNAIAQRVEILPRGIRQTSFPVRLPATAATLDVGTWASSEPAIFAVLQTSTGISVTVHSVGSGSRVIAAGLAQFARSRPAIRDFAIARAGGSRPDLFVIDRDPQTATTQLSIFSGESRFRALLVRRRLIAVSERKSWWFDVAQMRSGPASLILVRQGAGTPTGRPEVHVLSGRSGFRTFDVHEVLSDRISRMHQAGLGPSPAGPSLYSFTSIGSRTERVEITPITAAVFDEEC